MICLISLIVFSILGIGSLRYRRLAKEAFDCVFRRITFRPCRTNLDERIKSKITGKLMKRSPRLAGRIYKHFELISWVFTILLIVSLIYSGIGIFNLVNYGSCDPHSTTCIFNQGETSCGSEQCAEKGCECETEGCEAPEFEACEGNCDCKKNICG